MIIDSLPLLLSRLGITEWDALLVGDGSGSQWRRASGWAGVYVDRMSNQRQLFYGAASATSINYAETMPYLQGLSLYDHHIGQHLLAGRSQLRIIVVTDSQVVARWGTRSADFRNCPRNLRTLWFALHGLRQQGYDISFFWLGRSQLSLNVTADLIAGLARKQLEQLDVTKSVEAVSQRALLLSC